MRKSFALPVLVIMMIILFGCGDNEPIVPEPPSSLIALIGGDEHEISLQWLHSPSKVDGYRIRFAGETIGEVDADETLFIHRPPYLGSYSVTAFSGNAESPSIVAYLPQIHNDSTGLMSITLGGFRFDTQPVYQSRYTVWVGHGLSGNYGESSNEHLADSIDFYVDSLLWLHSPHHIVQQGRWADAFETRFYKLPSGIDLEEIDTIPRYDESRYIDSVRVTTPGEIIAAVLFRDNLVSASSEKIYAIMEIVIVNPTTAGFSFRYIMQTRNNYRLIREAP